MSNEDNAIVPECTVVAESPAMGDAGDAASDWPPNYVKVRLRNLSR